MKRIEREREGEGEEGEKGNDTNINIGFDCVKIYLLMNIHFQGHEVSKVIASLTRPFSKTYYLMGFLR